MPFDHKAYNRIKSARRRREKPEEARAYVARWKRANRERVNAMERIGQKRRRAKKALEEMEILRKLVKITQKLRH